MASSLTKKLVTKANASKFGRLLATLPTGTPPPSVPNLFRVVDVPNPFDDKIGILGSADAHHHVSASTLKSLADFVSERKQDLGKWASSVADFVSNQNVSLPDLVTVMDVLDDMCFTYSIEVYLLKVALLKVYEMVSKSNLDIPPHLKERILRLMRMVNIRSPENIDSFVKVSKDKVEVYADAPGFLKDHFQIIVEGHQLFITGLAVTPTSGTKVINKHLMIDASFHYDASGVVAVLENGLLMVKFPVGTAETMQAEPFPVKWE